MRKQKPFSVKQSKSKLADRSQEKEEKNLTTYKKKWSETVKNEALFFYIKRKGQKLNSSIADTATVGIERDREECCLVCEKVREI